MNEHLNDTQDPSVQQIVAGSVNAREQHTLEAYNPFNNSRTPVQVLYKLLGLHVLYISLLSSIEFKAEDINFHLIILCVHISVFLLSHYVGKGWKTRTFESDNKIDIVFRY